MEPRKKAAVKRGASAQGEFDEQGMLECRTLGQNSILHKGRMTMPDLFDLWQQRRNRRDPDPPGLLEVSDKRGPIGSVIFGVDGLGFVMERTWHEAKDLCK